MLWDEASVTDSKLVAKQVDCEVVYMEKDWFGSR